MTRAGIFVPTPDADLLHIRSGKGYKTLWPYKMAILVRAAAKAKHLRMGAYLCTLEERIRQDIPVEQVAELEELIAKAAKKAAAEKRKERAAKARKKAEQAHKRAEQAHKRAEQARK